MKRVLVILLLTGSAFAHRVALSWQASTSTVDHYRIYRALIAGGPYFLMGTVPANMLTFTNGSNPDGTALVEGQQYCYVATAIAGTQESDRSNEVCVMIPVTPTSPTNLQAQPF